MKKIGLICFLILQCLASFCQLATSDSNTTGNTNLSLPAVNFGYNSTAYNGSFSGHGRGHSLNSDAVLNMLSNRFNINIPVKYRYHIMGIDLQAGLLTNSKQPRLGASLSSPSGFSFSAGYGVSMTNFNRMGYSPMNSKNQGIQFTAGYRLFGKKR